MIKQLKKNDVQTTPFIATKSWELLNTEHEDLLVLDLPNGDFVALEFIDYSYAAPYGVLNTGCNLALEQQSADLAIFEEGVSGSGFFYPTEPQNLDGTYKRLIYHQVLRAFYNNYHNPLEMFGLEQIDFQTSGIEKYLSPTIRVFRLPKEKFGEKIQEGSITFVDNTFDDNYTVKDDSLGNLFAKPNLFSKKQEVRHIPNLVVDANVTIDCPSPVVGPPTAQIALFAELTNNTTAFVTWSAIPAATSYFLYRAQNFGPFLFFGSTPGNVTSSIDTTLSSVVTYSYVAQGFNLFGLSPISNTGSVLPTGSGPPVPPVVLSCTGSPFPPQLFTSSLDLTLQFDLT